MHQILVYGDSLSWGLIPGTRERLDFPNRWPGVVETQLREQQMEVRMIEDCLNGRRTVWEDPFKPGRNGLIGLEQRIEINSPLRLVIFFLGVNDFQCMHQADAFQSAAGLRCLVEAVRRAPVEPGMPTPEILLIAPPRLQKRESSVAAKFSDAAEKSVGLSAEIEAVADAMQCHFFDAAKVIQTSEIDGVHLDKGQNQKLGHELVPVLKPLLAKA